LHASPKSWFSASPSVMATVLAGMNSSLSPSGVVCTAFTPSSVMAVTRVSGYISTFSTCLKLLISPKRSDPPTSKPTFLRSSMMAVVRPVSMHRWPNSQPGRPPPMMATLRLMGHGDFSVIVRANDGV